MPLTAAGKKTLASLKKEYGDKNGESVFYAMMNEGKLKRSEMEETTKSRFEQAFGDRLSRVDISDLDKK